MTTLKRDRTLFTHHLFFSPPVTFLHESSRFHVNQTQTKDRLSQDNFLLDLSLSHFRMNHKHRLKTHFYKQYLKIKIN